MTMDPNAALEAIRREIRLLDAVAPPGSAPERLVEAFDALDEWLSRGGFLPSDWSALQR